MELEKLRSGPIKIDKTIKGTLAETTSVIKPSLPS
jgi:hypothetical protein